MNSLLLLVCISLTSANAAIPVISQSFSFEGTAEYIDGEGELTDFSRYDVAVDTSLSLLSIQTVFTVGTMDFLLESETGDLLIENKNGECTSGPYVPNSNNPFSLSTNPWSFLSEAFENPEGQFTFINGLTTINLRTVDGLPTYYSYTVNGGIPVTTVTISKFYNVTPPFYVFSLPQACSSVDCPPCYTGTQPVVTTPTSSAGGAYGSLVVLLLAIVTIMFIGM